MLLVIPLIISGLMLIVLFILAKKIKLWIAFNEQVKQLFSESPVISQKVFTYDQLTGLPEPVQRYFRYVLKNNQPYINCARLKHEGQFKSGRNKKWVNIEGVEYFITEHPGFIWKGKTNMFTARDMYLNNGGRLIVSIFSIHVISDENGEEFNQGELLRWLGESVWFPTNLLPGEKLHWTAIDQHSAKLTFNHCGYSVFYIVSFNETGEITKLETNRYMGKEKLEKWSGTLNDYKVMNGIIVPTTIEATWKLEKEDFTYAKFIIKNIEYDNPYAY